MVGGDGLGHRFPGGSVVKNLPAVQKMHFDPWVGKSPCRRAWQLSPVFLSGKSNGQRNMAGYSSWSHIRVGYNLTTKKTITNTF